MENIQFQLSNSVLLQSVNALMDSTTLEPTISLQNAPPQSYHLLLMIPVSSYTCSYLAYICFQQKTEAANIPP